jgi:hypothetical protein
MARLFSHGNGHLTQRRKDAKTQRRKDEYILSASVLHLHLRRSAVRAQVSRGSVYSAVRSTTMLDLPRPGGVDSYAHSLRLYTSTCLRLASIVPGIALAGETGTAEGGVPGA